MIYSEQGLTPAEASALKRAGFNLEPLEPGAGDALARTAADYEQLLAASITVRETADMIGVDIEEVYDRLSRRTLYGVKLEDGWRLPSFQFVRGQTLPGLEEVLPRLDPDLHPLEVSAWFTIPNPNLVISDTPVTPRDWLRVGQSVSEVAQLAAEL